ncbi:unnamed protein product [Knipowitschia caucasica]|uniref:G-protein coupled receptors family 1 profile domain-containing protein n=1 Tax=Knipowitschia caucasica TaxID=637954 RepID=A0AAV2K6N0_KNICA
MDGNYTQDRDPYSGFTSKLSPAADITVGLAILCTVLLSLVGNGLVLLVCYRRRRVLAGAELLCVNLAAVDFFCCVFFYPLSITSSFTHTWWGHSYTCVYYGLGCFIFGLCAMFTITAISVMRYLKTCCSLLYVWLDEVRVQYLCAGIWMVAALWSCFPLVGWGEYVLEPYGLSCTVAWRGYHTSTKDAVYVLCSFLCFTLLPVLLIVVTQGLILWEVSRFSCTLSARGIYNNLRHTERRLSMMFLCISLGFIMAWSPYAVVSFLFIFHRGPQYMAPEGFVFPALFAKSSHIYNPFIYFYFNKTFQRELRCLLGPAAVLLRGNRVGAPPGTRPGPPHIHIQLVEKNRKTRDQESHQRKEAPEEPRPVCVCWGSDQVQGHQEGPGAPKHGSI